VHEITYASKGMVTYKKFLINSEVLIPNLNAKIFILSQNCAKFFNSMENVQVNFGTIISECDVVLVIESVILFK
jgi:hypothetical protein